MTKRQENIILFLLAAVNFTHIIDFTIMMPMASQLIQDLKISHQSFSYLVSSYTISASISGFFMAFFVDTYDRKSVLLTGYIGFILGTIGCGLATTYEILITMRIITGFFGGLIGAQVFSIIGDVVPFERRGHAMGIITSAFSCASVVGLPFGLYVATTITWHTPFILVGFMGIMIIPLIYRFLPAMKGHITQQKGFNPINVIRPILQSKHQQMGVLLILTLTFGQFVIIPYLASYMISNVGFTQEQLPLIYFFGGFFTLFTSPLIGKFADNYGKFLVLIIGIITSTAMAFLLTNLTVVPIYLALLFTTLFFIFTGARIIPAQAITTSIVPPQQRGSYMSIMTSLQQLIMGLATFTAGNIIGEDLEGNLLNYHVIGYLSVVISILGVIITLQLRKIG
jgi:MFS transporter, DHA1 family, inner membrane transport protein